MKADKIKELILQNPKLPLVFSVGYEVVADDYSCNWIAYGNSARVDDYIIYDDGDISRFFDDYEQLAEHIADNEYDGSEEAYERAKIEAKNMKWIKAIIIHVDI